MPVRVGHFLHQVAGALLAGAFIAHIARLPAVRAQGVAQVAAGLVQVGGRGAQVYAQALERAFRAGLGGHARLADGAFQVLAQFAVQRGDVEGSRRWHIAWDEGATGRARTAIG